MPSKFFYKCDHLDEDETNSDQPAEVLMLINDESKVCIVTHDGGVENFTSIGYTPATEQLIVYSEEHPCGELLDYAIDTKLKQFVADAEEILYVNIDSDKGKVIQENWLPLKIVQ